MKILHIISDTILGGAQRVCIDLANNALNSGHEVAVAAMKGGNLWNELLPGVQHFELEYMLKKINKLDFKVLQELKRIRKEYKPDIIHLHTTKPGVLGRLAFRKDKKHIVYTVHGFDVIRTVHRKFLIVEKAMKSLCGAFVPVSEYDKHYMLEEGIKKNVYVIHNGIDNTKIIQEKAFPCPIKEKTKIISIARISPQKKFEMFLQVANHFNNEDVAFIWIGGSQNETLDELKKQYTISDNVYLLGDVPNASNYLNLCDIFVLFSNYEGLPMSIIEAMSQKLPCIASDVGGDSELIDESNGSLIKTEQEAVQAIRELLNNKELLKDKGNNSYNKYISEFSIEKMWKSYEDLYKSLLNN